MKKLLAILMLLCLLSTSALSDGDNVMIMEEYTAQYLDEAGNLWVYAVYAVENWNEYPASPTHISIMLLDKNGTPYQDIYYPLYPSVIPAGGRSYAVGIFCLTPEEQQNYGGVQVSFYPGDNPAPESPHMLPVESTVNGANAQSTITNDTGTDIESMKVVYLYRNEMNEIVGAYEADYPMAKDETLAVEHTFSFAPYTTVETLAFESKQ